MYSCNKSDLKPEEKPFLDLLNQPALVIDTSIVQSEWVYGFKFSITKSGNITALGMKLPKEGSYSVKLWDLDKNVLLAETSISSSAPHAAVFKTISQVNVEKNATLGIAVMANSFYKIRKSDLSDFIFPIQKGNINIISFNESKISENPSNKFPEKTNVSQMSPCVDIIFIAE